MTDIREKLYDENLSRVEKALEKYFLSPAERENYRQAALDGLKTAAEKFKISPDIPVERFPAYADWFIRSAIRYHHALSGSREQQFGGFASRCCGNLHEMMERRRAGLPPREDALEQDGCFEGYLEALNQNYQFCTGHSFQRRAANPLPEDDPE